MFSAKCVPLFRPLQSAQSCFSSSSTHYFLVKLFRHSEEIGFAVNLLKKVSQCFLCGLPISWGSRAFSSLFALLAMAVSWHLSCQNLAHFKEEELSLCWHRIKICCTVSYCLRSWARFACCFHLCLWVEHSMTFETWGLPSIWLHISNCDPREGTGIHLE